MGSKRNWKAANQDVTNGAAAIKSSERKDTHNHVPDPRDCSGVGRFIFIFRLIGGGGGGRVESIVFIKGLLFKTRKLFSL